VEVRSQEIMRSALDAVAPGTSLREGLEYIISARTGALIVIGDESRVEQLCNGGFVIQMPFTAQRLFELAKLDGAIILDGEAETILRANVHLVPDPELPTAETGMRHRTAERVSRQTGALVISVSQRRDVVSLYRAGHKLTLEDIDVVLAKANQALQTLQRYRTRLDEVSSRLMALEFEDMVTASDVVTVIQRSEMVQRVAREVARYIAELGTEGRLVRMQADELLVGVEEEHLALLRDYAKDPAPRKIAALKALIADIPADQLLEDQVVAQILGLPATADVAEYHVRPRGYRLLRRIPSLPVTVVNRLVERFGALGTLLEASEEELDDVDGVGPRRARTIREAIRHFRQRGPA